MAPVLALLGVFKLVVFLSLLGRLRGSARGIRVLGIGAVICSFAMEPVVAQVEEQVVASEARPGQEVLFEIIANRASVLAKKPFAKPESATPEVLANMNYSQYRSIRFNPNAALWRGQSDFEVQLFHPGFLYKDPITVNLVDDYSLFKELDFKPKDFIYERESKAIVDALAATGIDHNLGFSGFRVHYPVNNADYKDELLVFQGASYFRPVGPGQVYGLSARGVAVNTGGSEGEEFPRFSQFWLSKPSAGENRLVIGALLDSPSITGAFLFTVNSSVNTVVDVQARLYARKDIAKLGIAPLTSMFFYGENSPSRRGDFRPEIHDSDGLQIKHGHKEWIWRPLQNPASLQITSSILSKTQGFGLAQRDRDFNHYQDLEASYQRRPSLWVEPLNEWGPGRVELVEIPTPNETNDNIVAYWVSDTSVKAGAVLDYRYRLHTFDALPSGLNLATVKRTQIGSASVPGEPNPPPESDRIFVVEFSGGGIEKLHKSQILKANLEVTNGQARDLHVVKIDDTNTWRVSFKLRPNSGQAVDMRLSLSHRGQTLTEVWNYVWQSRNTK